MTPDPRAPVDRVAARVIRPATDRRASLSGKLSPDHQRRLAEIARCLAQGFPNPGTVHDWRGFSFGSLSVVGYLARAGTPGKRRHAWAVRCTCGGYDVRNADSLRRMASGKTHAAQACCFECQSVRHARGDFSNLPALP